MKIEFTKTDGNKTKGIVVFTIFRDNYDEWQRKKYLIKDGHIAGSGGYYGRNSRHDDYLSPWSTRYDHRYQVSRKGGRKDGNDDYGWWYGAPQSRRYNSRRRYRGYRDSVPEPPPLPWLEDKQVVKKNQGGAEGSVDPVTWYKGDMKSWWDKYVPADIAAKISTMVTDQITLMQKKLDHQELAMQKEITNLKREATDSDNERIKALNNLRNAKK